MVKLLSSSLEELVPYFHANFLHCFKAIGNKTGAKDVCATHSRFRQLF